MSSRSPSSSIVLVSFFRPSRMVARSGESKTLPLLLSPQFNLEHSVQQRVGRSSRAITTTDFTRSPPQFNKRKSGWRHQNPQLREDLRPFRRVIAPVCPYRVDSSTRDHAHRTLSLALSGVPAFIIALLLLFSLARAAGREGRQASRSPPEPKTLSPLSSKTRGFKSLSPHNSQTHHRVQRGPFSLQRFVDLAERGLDETPCGQLLRTYVASFRRGRRARSTAWLRAGR